MYVRQTRHTKLFPAERLWLFRMPSTQIFATELMTSKSTERWIIISISIAKPNWASSSIRNFAIHMCFNKVKFTAVPSLNINAASEFE